MSLNVSDDFIKSYLNKKRKKENDWTVSDGFLESINGYEDDDIAPVSESAMAELLAKHNAAREVIEYGKKRAEEEKKSKKKKKEKEKEATDEEKPEWMGNLNYRFEGDPAKVAMTRPATEKEMLGTSTWGEKVDEVTKLILSGGDPDYVQTDKLLRMISTQQGNIANDWTKKGNAELQGYYNTVVIAKNRDILSKTQMDGQNHSVLKEMEIISGLEGDEKEKRKEAVLKKMEELGMDAGNYALYTDDSNFNWSDFGNFTKNNLMEGLNSWNQGIFTTLDDTIGEGLKWLGWENNPVSMARDYYDELYDSYRQSADFYKERLGGGTVLQGADDFITGTGGALPDALLAIATMGTSTVPSSASLADNALMQSGTWLQKAGLKASSILKNPRYWLSYTRTWGQDYEEAKAQGASDVKASLGATITSLINAGIENGVDGMSGIQGLPQELAQGSGSAFKTWLFSGLEEMGEEPLQKAVNEITTKVLYNHDAEIFDPKEYAYESLMGGLVGWGLGGGQVAVGSGINAYQQYEANKLSADEQIVYDNVVEELIAEKEKDGKKLTAAEKRTIKKDARRALEDGTITVDMIEKVLGGENYSNFRGELEKFFGSEDYKAYQKALQEEEALRQEYKELGEKGTTNLAEMARFNDLHQMMKDIKTNSRAEALHAKLSPEASRIAHLRDAMRGEVINRVSNSRLAESYRELERSKQKFTVDVNKYTDENARTTVQAILDSGLGDNSNAFHNTVDFWAKLSADHGLTIKTVDNEMLKGTKHHKEGYVTNGFRIGDEIVVNMDSPKVLNTTVGHELTHVFEVAGNYEQLSKTAINYFVAKEGLDKFNARLKEAEEVYKGDKNTTPEKEVVADIIGEYLFTDYDFIQHLAKTDRNGFMRIWDEVKYFAKIATAGSKEAREFERLKREFERAYNENLKGKETEDVEQNSYSRPDLNKDEWAIVNRRKYSEFNNPKFDLDNDTKWMYVNEKGTTVFAIYSKNDAEDPTVLYGSSGEKAVSDYETLNAYFRGELNVKHSRTKPNRRTLNAILADINSEKGNEGTGLPSATGKESATSDVQFPFAESRGDGRGNYVDGSANLHETELTEYNDEAPDNSGASFITFSNDYATIRNFMKDGDVDGEVEDSNVQYSLVKDQETIDWLENQEYLTVYKAMQVIDGKLYPPMSAEVETTEEYTTKKGETKTRKVRKLKQASELGKWQQSDERPDLVTNFAPPSKKYPDGYGRFDLLKGTGDKSDDLKGVAYNPYEHTSNIVMNDQFSSAYRRDNLVTVEYHIPKSELTSGYKAMYAKDPVGLTDWKAGGVAQKLKNSHRDVYLTRWAKPVRVLDDAEVAMKYKEILDKEEGISIPWNVVTPNLLAEMQKIGVPIDYSDVKFGSAIRSYEAAMRGEYGEVPAANLDDLGKGYLDSKSIQYSYSAIPSHKQSLEKHFDSENASVDLETINNRYDKIIDIWERLGGELNSKFLNDWNNKVERPFTVFKAQAGYKYNVELSSMCKKGVPLFEAIDTIVKKEVMKELGTEVLGKEEKEILYDILKQHHFEIPCAICYVEQARQREGVIIDAFLNGKTDVNGKGETTGVKLGWNQVLDSIQKEMKANGVDYNFAYVSRDIATDTYEPADLKMDEQTYTAFAEAVKKVANEEITRYNKETGKNRKLLKNVTPEAVKECFKGTLPSNLKIFKVLLTEPSSRFRIQNDLLYSSMTTKNLTMAHNGLYGLFNSQGGVSGYKTKQAPTVYWGEILGKKWKPSDTRKEGGVRNQSNSDFQMYTLLDQAQMYMDFTAKGYYLQAYTKVLSELKLFGLSRGKINASLIPSVKIYRNADGSVDVEKTMANAGLDENGNLFFDDIEGISHKEAFMLLEDPEYSKNIGGICIGYSDNHIWKLLDDNRVQLIIGFHDKTNDPDKRYRGAKYAKNYNGLNEALKNKADGKTETVHVGFNPFVKKAEDKFTYNKKTEVFEGTVDYNGKTYTADDIPRLAADLYLEYCAKKNFTPAYNDFKGHKNYYKLLADFSLYDSEGHYAPHQKVAYNMPDSVPYLDADGNKQYMDTEKYIKIELQKELAVRDAIAEAMADTSEDGIIPQFKAEVKKRKGTQFSLSKPVEETRDLMALHNLKTDELLKSFDLGGFPMPSIAVIKADAGHDEYGEISLVFPKDTIDPRQDKANKVYGGDAWTPTYPRIEYKPSEAVAKRVRDRYYEMSSNYGYDETKPLYKYQYDMEAVLNNAGGEAGLLERLYDDADLMQLYLQDSGKGKVAPVVTETETRMSDVEIAMSQYVINALGVDVIEQYKAPAGVMPIGHINKFMETHDAEIKAAYMQYFIDEHGFTEEQASNVVNNTSKGQLLKYVRNAYNYTQNNGITINTETNYKATEEAIRAAAEDGYKAWVDDLFNGVEEKTGIRNGASSFTPSGNRRGWDALHWEETLENVVKAMKAQDQTGADAFFGPNKIFATAAKEYRSIKDIKADSDRLRTIPKEEYDAMKEGLVGRFADIATRLMDTAHDNPFIAKEQAMECIVDAVRSSKTRNGISQKLTEFGMEFTENDIDDIVSLVNDIANMPTGYFEAKPQRAVGFDEVAVFVIPRNADIKLKQELLNRGYNIAEYDPDIEGDRTKVVNQLDDYKFSLSNVDEESNGIIRERGTDFGYYDPLEEFDIAPVREDAYYHAPKAETVKTNVDVPEDDYREAFEAITDEDAPPVMERTSAPKEITTVEERLQQKIKNTEAELEKNRQYREQALKDYDEEIALVQEKLESKRNQDSKIAQNLRRRIERLTRLRADINADYSKRISDLENRLEKMNSPEYKTSEQRRAKMQEHTDFWAATLGDTSTWKDMALGLAYKTKTLRRILRHVVKDANGKPDYAKADAIYDALETKYDHNEALLKRESQKLKEKFFELNLNHTEDTYAHMLGELRYNPQTTLTEDVVKEYYKKHKSKIDTAKVNNAINEARKTFDDLIVRVNEVLKEQGMKEIPYRKGYFPHFTNPKQGWLAKLLNWKTVDNEIPTSIAGLTETFDPQRSWQGFNKERKGDKTDYSLYQGLDTYIHGALDWIYHIDDLQSRRSLENYIRYIHSEEGVKAKIDEIKANEYLDADQTQVAIDAVLAEAKNPLNNLVTELRARTNTLANKKASMDRGMEEATNRKIYSTMTNLNNRINANMVVGSFSSALTNFIPMVQSWHQVSPWFTVRGLGDMIRSTIKDDGMVARSDFLTNRLVEEEKLYQTGWDKVSDKAAFMMNAIDSITSQTVWRSKYLQNIKEGMSESGAIKDADQFAKNLLAGRSRGNMPTIFDAKNPLIKMFTSFQLEVANQYGYMFDDTPKDVKNKARLVKGYATALLGAYAYNALYSAIVGRDSALDPIGIIEDFLRDLFDDDDEEENVPDALMGLGENIVQEVPFVGGFFGGGRVPVSSALPYNGYSTPIESMMTDVSEGNWDNFGKEFLKPLYYLAMPVGGGQLKKTVEGLSMFDDDLPITGSYTSSGKLRFPVEKNVGNVIKAGLFGQYASKNAREYFDNDYAPLGEKQIKEYIKSDIPISDYWEYRKGLRGLSKLEEKADYIDSLDLPISTKNLFINNIADRKERIDMTSYGDYSDFEEFDYAQKNPGKYAVSKAVTSDFDEYQQYSDDLNDIRADKDKNGKTISGSAKQKKADYINSLNIPYEAKLVLFKKEYPADDTYNNEILAYVNSLDYITFDEKLALMRELGFTVRDDGFVSWD